MARSAPAGAGGAAPGLRGSMPRHVPGPEVRTLPVLPLIDLMILLGWTSLLFAFVLKGISLAMLRGIGFLGLTSFDFLLISMACLLFAITLAARTWVKANEPRLVARRHVGSYGLERLEEGTATDGDAAEAHAPAAPHAKAGRTRTELATGGR
jgi:hypothetical protein